MSSPCLTTREVHLEKTRELRTTQRTPYHITISPPTNRNQPLSTNRTYKAPKNKTEEEQADSGYPLPFHFFFTSNALLAHGMVICWIGTPVIEDSFGIFWGHVLFLKSDLWLFICVYICVYIYYMRVHLKLPYPKKHALLQSFRNLVWMEQNLLTLVYVHPSSESSYGWIWMIEINPR